MPKFVAFLRAINVGGHTVKMERLKKLFEALGLSSVETFIASGNVIFTSGSKDTKKLGKKIEAHLQKSLGYEVATFIRSTSELTEIARYKPFPDSELNADGNSFYIGFVAEPPSAEAKKKLLGFSSKVDEFHIHNREVFWLCRKKFSDSEFSGGLLEKTLGMPVTLRNSTTVKKLATKYA